jgi:hypothetical protein
MPPSRWLECAHRTPPKEAAHPASFPPHCLPQASLSSGPTSASVHSFTFFQSFLPHGPS